LCVALVHLHSILVRYFSKGGEGKTGSTTRQLCLSQSFSPLLALFFFILLWSSESILSAIGALFFRSFLVCCVLDILLTEDKKKIIHWPSHFFSILFGRLHHPLPFLFFLFLLHSFFPSYSSPPPFRPVSVLPPPLFTHTLGLLSSLSLSLSLSFSHSIPPHSPL
jgi:hypothetical protein